MESKCRRNDTCVCLVSGIVILFYFFWVEKVPLAFLWATCRRRYEDECVPPSYITFSSSFLLLIRTTKKGDWEEFISFFFPGSTKKLFHSAVLRDSLHTRNFFLKGPKMAANNSLKGESIRRDINVSCIIINKSPFFFFLYQRSEIHPFNWISCPSTLYRYLEMWVVWKEHLRSNLKKKNQ